MRRETATAILFALLLWSAPASACARADISVNTSPYFTVRVTNSYGPVVGLPLSVTHFRADEYSKAVEDKRSALERTTDAIADTNDNTPHAHALSQQAKATNMADYIDVVATAITNSKGEAHFHLDRVGSFYLSADHPESVISDVLLNVSGDATSATVDVGWPEDPILETTSAKGRIEDGLYESTGEPLNSAVVSLRELVSYKEVSVTTTAEDGSFQFPGIAPGLYFLAVKGKEEGLKTPDGTIPILLTATAPRVSLSIAVAETDCGLMYDLAENKSKHKPAYCIQGGQQVPCQY